MSAGPSSGSRLCHLAVRFSDRCKKRPFVEQFRKPPCRPCQTGPPMAASRGTGLELQKHLPQVFGIRRHPTRIIMLAQANSGRRPVLEFLSVWNSYQYSYQSEERYPEA